MQPEFQFHLCPQWHRLLPQWLTNTPFPCQCDFFFVVGEGISRSEPMRGEEEICWGFWEGKLCFYLWWVSRHSGKPVGVLWGHGRRVVWD